MSFSKFLIRFGNHTHILYTFSTRSCISLRPQVISLADLQLPHYSLAYKIARIRLIASFFLFLVLREQLSPIPSEVPQPQKI